MDILPTMCRKDKEDIYLAWLDPDTLDTTSIFASEGGLDWAFTEVGP